MVFVAAATMLELCPITTSPHNADRRVGRGEFAGVLVLFSPRKVHGRTGAQPKPGWWRSDNVGGLNIQRVFTARLVVRTRRH